jgi:hypothetical protein
MKQLLLLLGISMFAASPVVAGKNAGGTLIVHTDDAYGWTAGLCDDFDGLVVDACYCMNTRTDKDENTPALIWLVAYLPGGSPGVTVVYFGNDHNLPEYHHNRYGFCGPLGSIEVPDAGWPDSPSTAGNSLAFGSPIVDDHLFAFYYVDVWGFAGAYYGTGINPVGGYAGFMDDSNPPELDEISHFGCVRWYEAGYNECPAGGWGAGSCCLPDGSCHEWEWEYCMSQGGEFLGCTPCDPNPCVTSSVPEVSTETVTWGRIKSTYRE